MKSELSDGTKTSYKPGPPREIGTCSKTVIKATSKELRQMVMGAVLGRPVIHNWSHGWSLKPLFGKEAKKSNKPKGEVLTAQAIY
jgi:hypothetical protein